MAKTFGPLFSLGASQAIGKSIVYSNWRGVSYVRKYMIPRNPKTDDQKLIRDLIKQSTQAWKTNATISPTTIDVAYKLAYAEAAHGQSFSGFNMYVRDCVAKNWDSTASPQFDGTLVLPTEPGDSI